MDLQNHMKDHVITSSLIFCNTVVLGLCWCQNMVKLCKRRKDVSCNHSITWSPYSSLCNPWGY